MGKPNNADVKKPVNNFDIFDFYNPGVLFDMAKIKGMGIDFRYLKDFVNTKISMFKYKNLPEGLTSRILETSLCIRPYLCFYKNTIYPNGILCQYQPTGEYQEYWLPTEVNLMTFTNKPIGRVKFSEIVPLRDNSMEILPIITIFEYIKKIQFAEATLTKNIKQARIPAIFTGTKEQVATFNRMIQKAEADDAFAIGDKTTADAMSQYNFTFPIQPESTIEIMKNYMNWCVSSFGIYGSGTQKSERMLTGEVQSLNDYTDAIYQDELDCRKEQIELANKMFGWNIEIVESYKEYTEEHIKLSQAYAVAQVQNQGKFGNDGKGDNNE